MRRGVSSTILVVAALTLFGAACGSGDDSTGTQVASAAEETALDPTSGAGEETAGGPWISVAPSSLGEILVDADGLTLYLLISDSEGAGGCTGPCADLWPPVPHDDVGVLGDGVDASLLSQTERENGSIQAVYNGHPLYRYSGDSGPGDVNGQGVNSTWFVIDVTGTAVGVVVEEDPLEEPGSNPFGY